MVCPRCDRAQIERDGVVIRCAVCGMSYEPSRDITTQSLENCAAVPRSLAAAACFPRQTLRSR